MNIPDDAHHENKNGNENERSSTTNDGIEHCHHEQGSCSRTGSENEITDETPLLAICNEEVTTNHGCALAMITVGVTIALAAGSFQDEIISQYLYKVYAKNIFGNLSVDTTRDPCGNTSSKDSDQIQEIQDKTTNTFLCLNILSYGIGMFTNIFFGVFSHLLHRRAQLLIPLFGYTLRCTVLLVVVFWDLSINWLFIGFGIDGLCGTFLGVYLGSFLYTSDITSRDSKRTFGIALLESTKGTMGGLVKIAAGYLLNQNAFTISCLGVIGLLLLTILIVTQLPNHKPKMKMSDTKSLSPKTALRIMMGPFNTGSKQVTIMVTLAMLTFLTFITINLGIDRIYSLYLMDLPFCWSAIGIGWFNCARQVSANLLIIIGIAIFYRCLPGLSLGIIGQTLLIGCFILYALATTTQEILSGLSLYIGIGFPIALIRGETSRILDPYLQGPLFACFAVLESVAFFLSPVIVLNIYRVSLYTYKGLPFLFAAVANLVPLFSLIFHQKFLRRFTKKEFNSIQEQEQQ